MPLAYEVKSRISVPEWAVTDMKIRENYIKTVKKLDL
jgi:hypothetical protein